MKKGFTLVETIGVLLILALIFLLVFPNMTNRFAKGNIAISKLNKIHIKDAFDAYLKDNKIMYPDGDYCINISELTDENYLDKLQKEELNDNEVKSANVEVKESNSVDIKYNKTLCSNRTLSEHLKLNGSETVLVEYKTNSYTEEGVTIKNVTKTSTQTLQLIRTVYDKEMNVLDEQTKSITDNNVNNVSLTSFTNTSIPNTELENYIIKYNLVLKDNGTKLIDEIVYRKVKIADTIAPVITLKSSNPFIMEIVTSYNINNIYTVSDKSDNITTNVKTDLTLGVIGRYKTVITATDESGNKSTKTVYITIGEIQPGYYDMNDNLLYTWDQLVTNFGLDVESDYDSLAGKYPPSEDIFQKKILVYGKLVLPKSIKKIGNEAFRCSIGGYLKEIIIPDSVTSIGSGAFSTSWIENYSIGSGVNYIAPDAFHEITQSKKITISPANSKYDSRNDCNCIIETASNKLIVASNNTIIPNTVTTLGANSFHMLGKITSLNIPDSVETIEEEAFSHSNLNNIYIGTGLRTIHYSAFVGARNITNLQIDLNNPNFDSRDNCNCVIETASNKLIVTTIATTIPSTVLTIGTNSFRLSSKTSVEIPNGVKNIETNAFALADLRSIDIPDSVSSIAAHAFYTSREMTAVTIGSGVTSISPGAFASLNGTVGSITVSGDNQKYDSRDNCNCVVETATNRLVASSSLTVIPDSVTTIGQSAFARSKMTSIIIPGTVTAIEESAFRGAFKVETITIPSSVTFIGPSAFIDTSKLGSIIFEAPNGWKKCTSSCNNTLINFTDPSQNVKILKKELTPSYMKD